MRFLCIPYTHALSHVSRPLRVAQELGNRGHEIVFAGSSSKTRFIRDAGFPVIPLHEPDPDLLFGNIRKGKLRFVDDDELARMIDADRALFREVRPDLVLSDGRFSAGISTALEGIRHAAIVNVSSTAYRALPYIPFFNWIPPWLMKRDGFIWNTLDSFNLVVEKYIFDRGMPVFTKLSSRNGIYPPVTATSCLTGKDLTLLADIPEYFPTKNLPTSYQYIGPLTWKQNLSAPRWWPPSRDRGPIIYVTMGTTGVADFFRIITEIFANSGMIVIVSTGAQISHLGSHQGDFFFEEYLDGDLVMDVCDLVICHGGNGTIYQALSHGRPVIGIPTIPDQTFNMRRVEALGVGKMLKWNEFVKNPACLMTEIDQVLRNSCYRLNAELMQKMLLSYDGAKRAADLLLNLFSLSF